MSAPIPLGVRGRWCFVPPTPQGPTGEAQVSLYPQTTGSHGLGACVVSPPKLQGPLNLEAQLPPVPTQDEV